MNGLKTLMLLATLTALLLGLAQTFGGQVGLWIALAVAGLLCIGL